MVVGIAPAYHLCAGSMGGHEGEQVLWDSKRTLAFLQSLLWLQPLWRFQKAVLPSSCKFHFILEAAILNQ